MSEKGKAGLSKEYEEAEKWLAGKREGSSGETAQKQKHNATDRLHSSNLTKKCPFCSEEIKIDAVKCRYCSEWLSKQKDTKFTSSVKNKSKISRNIINAIPFIWNELPVGPRLIIILVLIFILASVIAVINKGDRTQIVRPSEIIARPPEITPQEQSITAEEEHSAALLARCRSSCNNVSGLFEGGSTALIRSLEQESQCKSQCEQQAATRNIEIRKLKAMQK